MPTSTWAWPAGRWGKGPAGNRRPHLGIFPVSPTVESIVLLDISYTGNYATNSTLGGQDIVVTAYAVTPEPGTWSLLLSGLVGLGLYKRRHASPAL